MIYFIIGVGGIIGALLRYLVGVILVTDSFAGFPLGTLLINLVGCFLLSWFTIWSIKKKPLPTWFRLSFTTGLIGSFTTFSTFSVELIELITNKAWVFAILYFMVSSLGGYACSLLGYYLAIQKEETI